MALKKAGFNRGARIPFKKKEAEHKINHFITSAEVRVIGEDLEPAIFPLAQALQMAEEQGLDLVEISPKAIPPVCRIIDYKKFLFEKKKKDKEIKAKTKQTIIKDIRFGPNTDDHDFQFKLKHAATFLENGEKVRAFVHFRGRSIMYKDRGEILLLKFAQALEDVGKVELLPKLEGKRMFLTIGPKNSKK